MFHGRKKKGTRFGLNKKGFSLVEILVAIGILVMITVPLAMNMISSSQINSKAKQTAGASDLTTSILEMMQTVDLSDVLVDVNGYATNEYGFDLPYTLTGTALKDYTIGNKLEVVVDDSGTVTKYLPVTNPEEAVQTLKSSLKVIKTGDATRAYFVGQDSDKYAFVLSEVETDEASFDIVATIVPEQKFDIVNIISMAQTEVLHAKQPIGINRDIAKEFKSSHDLYRATRGGDIKDEDWFYNNMTRTITIKIQKEPGVVNATTVTIDAVYKVELDAMYNADKTIKKHLGGFTTNSTAELARGVYLYYYPLVDNGAVVRDKIIIENKNNLATPVFLVALADGVVVDYSKATNYHPELYVYEHLDSATIYVDTARTTVCSNVPNDLWIKTLEPTGRALDVKTLGNASEQQTLYTLTLKIYRHRDESFADDNTFTPRDKDLLVETKGSFIDTSEILDLETDESSGLITQDPSMGSMQAFAQAVSGIKYDGQEHCGVNGLNVTWSGTTHATNAGTYTARATPNPGCKWGDGSTGPRIFTWTIERIPGAQVYTASYQYNARFLQGAVSVHNVSLSGQTSARNAGSYTFFATPRPNYTWPDGSTGTKSFHWSIARAPITVNWRTGEGYDRWPYDGNGHYGSFTISGWLEDANGNLESGSVSVTNNYIRDPGTVTVIAQSPTNPNYYIARGGSHTLTVYHSSSNTYFSISDTTLVYNGQQQGPSISSYGVRISGTTRAKNVGTYQIHATPATGFTWPGGGTYTRTIQWSITPKEVGLLWGTHTWIYDGITHSTTCTVVGAVNGETVTVGITNNSIRDIGSVTATATSLSNRNYQISSSSSLSCVLTVTSAPLASYQKYDYEYDGHVHTGIVGQHVYISGTTQTSEVAWTAVGDDVIVGHHSAVLTPLPNYAWSDGTTGSKTVYWKITPKADAEVFCANRDYSGTETVGVYGRNIQITGTASAIAKGQYVAWAIPVANHAWADTGTAEKRECVWTIEDTSYWIPAFVESELVYNGTEQSPGLTAASLHPGYTLSGTLSATKVGTYTAIAKLVDAANSTWSDGTRTDKTITWKIVPKEITLTFNNSANTWEYDGSTHTATAIVGGLCGSDTCTVTYANNTRKDVGSHQFTVTGVSNPNYKLPSNIYGIITITKRVVSINWGTTEWVYDGTQKTVTATAGNVKSGDTVTFTYSNNTRTDAGSQTVTITGISSSSGNYQLPTNTSNCSITMTINPKLITVNWGTTKWEFDGNQHSATPTFSGLVAGQSIAPSTIANNKIIEVGTKTVSIVGYAHTSGTKLSNYLIKGDSTTIEVTPKPITITWGTTTWTYDGATHIVVPSIKSSDIHPAYPVSPIASNNSRTIAGSQTVTVVLDNKNYTISGSNTCTLTINKAASHIVPPVAKTGLAYNGNSHQLCTAGSTKYGYVYYSLTNASGSWSTAVPSATNAGTYTVYYYSSGDDNHSASAVGSITVTIAGIADASCWGVGTKTYNGNSQQMNGGSNVVKVSGSQYGTNVGTYTAAYKPATNHAWSDTGTFETRYRTGYITALTDAYCTQRYSVTYTGTAFGGCVSQSSVNLSGQTTGINAGTYVFYATPAANHAWSDTGTTEQRQYTWKINKATAVLSYSNTLFAYNGSPHGPTMGGNSAVYWYGTKTAIDAGTYTVYAAIADPTNYQWSDGTTGAKAKTWTISRAKAASMSYKNSVIFGLGGVAYCNPVGTHCSVTSGQTSAGVTGSYSFVATAHSNYAFSDGSVTKTFWWTATNIMDQH